MRASTFFLPLLLAGLWLGCGGGAPTSFSPPPVPASEFEITTLLTVYQNSESGALWTRGTTRDERIGKILLGVEDLNSVSGSTNLNNEGTREQLQAAIDRLRQQFRDSDYVPAFDETRANLERYLNDADGDGWSIDGRNGAGRDWPYDQDGNDPDGWTAQMIVTVTRLD